MLNALLGSFAIEHFGATIMPNDIVFSNIKRAIEKAPRNGYVAELHLQVLKI
jgi:hypothetical protein